MLLRWQHLTVGRPEIGVAQALLIPLGDALPQHAASGFASVADGIRDDLARPPALGQPDPALVPATLNKRPHLVEFKNVRLVGLCQCLLQGVSSSRSVFFKECLLQGVSSSRSVFFKECLLQGVFSSRSVFFKECFLQGVFSSRSVFFKECFLQGRQVRGFF